MSSVARNPNIGKLQAGYLFPEIGRRRNAYLEANPDAQPIISLGIGDTTVPVPPHILKGLTEGAAKLGTAEGYSGYGPEQGVAALRSKIADNLYDGKISPDEASTCLALGPPAPRLGALGARHSPSIEAGNARDSLASTACIAWQVFVSDGSKCDIGRLQMMFGKETTTAVQDPSYPVYVDTSVIMGRASPTQPDPAISRMPCGSRQAQPASSVQCARCRAHRLLRLPAKWMVG